ncbi:MAG: glycosyltransferase [Caulobacteraceae bacterium]
MSRFLFATWEGGGHVQPMLLAAKGLLDAGHEALAISDACNVRDSAALGVPFQPWRKAPSRRDRNPATDPLKDWLAKSPLDVIRQLVDGVTCGPAAAYARDTVKAIDDFAPDVVVSQELLFGVMAGAEARRRPLALFAANVWSLPTIDSAPPFGAGAGPAGDDESMRAFYATVAATTRGAFQGGLPGYNRMRYELGLGPLQDLFEQVDAAGQILLATSRAFDFDQTPPEPYRYVGPYLADPPWTQAWTSPWPADDQRPLVLVSFSTMYQAQEDVLHRVIEALGGLDVRGLVTLGPVLSPADFPAPANVHVTRSAPHSQIFPSAGAVVTHAGHASTLRPLLAGVPLVCIPLGRDQPDNAQRVAGRGAGLRLHPEAAIDEIAAAIQRVLTEGAFREAARALGRRIAVDCEARSAEKELIRFAESAGRHDQADLLPRQAASSVA